MKKTRYILMSKRSTLQKKDQEAEAGRVIHRGSPLFGTANVVRKSGYEEKYDSLLRENALLFTLDLIKEKLDEAYRDTDEARMAEKIIDIMDICEATGNSHLLWFRKLLDEHFEGIIAHATFQITSGKVEGINHRSPAARSRASTRKSKPSGGTATDTRMMNTSSSSYSTLAAEPMTAIPNPTGFVIEP